MNGREDKKVVEVLVGELERKAMEVSAEHLGESNMKRNELRNCERSPKRIVD